MSKKHNFQAGQRVRVGRDAWHAIRFGAICTVVQVYADGDISVAGPSCSKLGHFDREIIRQIVDGNTCRLAKQAIKKG